MNALVVYYSRTGTTKKVADKLAALLKCAIEEIHDTKNRKGVAGWLRAGKDATSKKRAREQSLKPDIYRANSFDGVLDFSSKNLRIYKHK